jgi:ribonuclease P/MRP protein subunit RPP40
MYQEQLLEWIGLILIDSLRIQRDDQIDPYLCRYELPEAFEATISTKVENLTHLRWHGLVPSRFLREVLQILEPGLNNEWFVIGSKGFEGKTCFALAKGQDVLYWNLI